MRARFGISWLCFLCFIFIYTGLTRTYFVISCTEYASFTSIIFIKDGRRRHILTCITLWPQVHINVKDEWTGYFLKFQWVFLMYLYLDWAIFNPLYSLKIILLSKSGEIFDRNTLSFMLFQLELEVFMIIYFRYIQWLKVEFWLHHLPKWCLLYPILGTG